MVSRYVGTDLAPSLRLKCLFGERWRFLQPDQHPLGLARHALDKYMAGLIPLTDAERSAMTSFKLLAEIVDKTEQHWAPNRHRLIDDLLSARRCRPLLFEVHVIAYCLAPNVTDFEWPIYREGERDVRTFGPDMLVECKLIEVVDIRKVLKRTKDARQQPRPTHLPFVVAVGFKDRLSAQQMNELTEQVRSQRDWFIARPDLTALLIVAETTSPLDDREWNPLGLTGRITIVGGILETRNQKANNALPETFSFGGADGRGRMAAAMRSDVRGEVT